MVASRKINGKYLWQTADYLEKTGLYIFTCLSCGGADQRLPFPMAAASQNVISRWQTTHHSNRVWAVWISIKNK
jgi:hypothetical protein